MTHQANNVKGIINAHILKQVIEKSLKALGAAKVEFNNYIFHGKPQKAAMAGLYGAPEGRIEVLWPDSRKATISVDFMHIDYLLKVENAKGIKSYAECIVRNLVNSRMDDALKDFKVEIPFDSL